jgi:hypothetical protein
VQSAAPGLTPTQVEVRDIKQTLLAWMEAKARAMGPQHEATALDPVLHGAMLRQWRARVKRLRSQDWHWNYEVSRISARIPALHTPLHAQPHALGGLLRRADMHAAPWILLSRITAPQPRLRAS